MVVLKDRKVKRHRGHNSHGWGAKKKHRGSGNRGGKGNAGSGKRGDSKKPTLWKNRVKLGKFGFKIKGQRKDIIVISIKALEQKMNQLIIEEKASLSKDLYTVDLGKIGYDKLVANGNATVKMHIIVDYASPSAVEKVEHLGGSVSISTKSSGEE
jgi:large subunit ribosomal protein L15